MTEIESFQTAGFSTTLQVALVFTKGEHLRIVLEL
jgi:hypothetical protein